MQFDCFPCKDDWKTLAERLMAKGQAEGSIPVDRQMLNGSEWLFVARQPTHDGYIIAGIGVFCCPDLGLLWLDVLYVEPEFRGQGIGLKLLQRIREFAIADGRFDTFGLGTMLENSTMQGLARKAGIGGGQVYYYQPLECGR